MSEQDELSKELQELFLKYLSECLVGKVVPLELAKIRTRDFLAKVKQHYETLIEDTLRDFSDIQREKGHPESYWAGYHYARNLMLSAIGKNPYEQKRLDRPELREKIARILCCFAKDNKSCAECEYNTIDSPFPDCFEDIREETDKLLPLIPDIEEANRLGWMSPEECQECQAQTEYKIEEASLRKQPITDKIFSLKDLEEARSKEGERIGKLYDRDIKPYINLHSLSGKLYRFRQALKGGGE